MQVQKIVSSGHPRYPFLPTPLFPHPDFPSVDLGWCRDLAYAIEDSQASLVLVTAELASRIQPLLASSAAQMNVLSSSEANSHSAACGSSGSWTSVVEAAVDKAQSKDGALIIYTSGTTGKPKGEHPQLMRGRVQ